MQKAHLALGGTLTMAALLGLSAAWASDVRPPIAVTRGSVQVRQANGQWVSSTKIPLGSWVKSTQGETTLQAGGVTMRLEPGSQVKVASVSDASALEARGGRVFVKIDSSNTCQVKLKKNLVVASESEFVVDAGASERIYVLSGQAQFADAKVEPAALENWASDTSEIALDGPDVRRRNRNRRRFTQGEENKGKRIGEDLPPSQTPAYTPTETPAYTPSYTPTATPSANVPTPSPSPQPPPQAVDGGFNPWPLIGGLAGAGGITAFILTRDDDEEQIIIPASR